MNDMVMKLDDIGRPAWIALMVASFIVFWPLGLFVLAFLLWSGRMGCGWSGGRSRWDSRMADKWERRAGRFRDAAGFGGFGSSGNRAFDDYRDATLRRLEEEQREFRDFLERLRLAKDRAEFDEFMNDRRNRPAGAPPPQPNRSPSLSAPSVTRHPSRESHDQGGERVLMDPLFVCRWLIPEFCHQVTS